MSRYLWPGAVGRLADIRDIPTLLDWDDLDHLKLKSQIEMSPWAGIGGFVAKFLTLRKLTKTCLAEAASYDHIWVTKTSDVARIAGKSVSVLPTYRSSTMRRKDQCSRRIVKTSCSLETLPISPIPMPYKIPRASVAARACRLPECACAGDWPAAFCRRQ